VSVLVNKDTRVLVQGITGSAGSFHAKLMLEYGTKIVGGVTPGRGGQKFENKVPIFDTVEQAVKGTGANATVVYVPPAFAADAILEAMDGGISLIIAITEGIPILDMVKVKRSLGSRPKARLIGPNCPGIITPGECKIGIMPGHIHKPGHVGVVSRSGTLTYEAVDQLTKLGIGQSTCIGIGGDPVNGTNFIDCLKLFNDDPETEAVVMIGEIGGTAEEAAAQWAANNMTKPIAAFVAGSSAPKGKRMGHAGAIISGGKGTAKEKFAALENAGIATTANPAEIGITLKKALEKHH